MITLTPTKDTGATSKANEVLYVEPGRTVTDDDLATDLGIEGMNAAFIADFLSACLAHERCGTHLYRSVAERTANPVLQARYQELGAQTLRHVEVLESLIAASGGNPSYVSPLARATETADTKVLEATFLGSGALDPMTAEMAMLDAVFLAETIDHANWEGLGQLVEALPDGSVLREELRAAVAEVQAEEDEHLGWARDTRAQLTMLQASSSLATKAATKAEELLAKVKGWFGGGSGVGEVAARQAPTTSRRSAPKTAPAKKKATAKKGAATRAPAKKTAATKATAKKTTAAKAPARKTTAKRPAKKSAAKKSAAKKSAAKKSAAKKSAAKSAPAKRTAAEKATSKATAKRSPAKSTAKKSTAKKVSAQRTSRGSRR